jgi:hypothetical protein
MRSTDHTTKERISRFTSLPEDTLRRLRLRVLRTPPMRGVWNVRYQAWLERGVEQGKTLGEIAESPGMPRTPAMPLGSEWRVLREHVIWLVGKHAAAVVEDPATGEAVFAPNHLTA